MWGLVFCGSEGCWVDGLDAELWPNRPPAPNSGGARSVGWVQQRETQRRKLPWGKPLFLAELFDVRSAIVFRLYIKQGFIGC
jgi:hypothetical protein